MDATDFEEIERLVNEIRSQRYSSSSSNEPSSEQPKPKPKPKSIMNSFGENHFRELVKSLLRLEDDLDEISKHAKQLRALKKEHREKIMQYMEDHHLESLNLPDGGMFTLKILNSKINPLTKTRLPENLVKYFQEKENMKFDLANNKAIEVLSFIDSVAELKETKSLRKIKPKK